MSGKTKKPWTQLSSRIAYENRWIKIQEDQVLRPDGKPGMYAFLHKKPGNFIVPVNQDGEIYFIKEYKYPIKKEMLQIPGGVIETSDILFQAKKELLEETGLLAETWVELGTIYVAPGHETLVNHIWLACDLSLENKGVSNQEGDESIIEVIPISPMIVFDMIRNGEITDAVTLAALLMYFHSK